MQKVKGRIVYCDKNNLVLARDNKLFESDDNGKTWSLKYKITLKAFDKICYRFSLVKRLLRLGIHHYVINNEREAVFIGRKIIVYKNRKIEFVDIIRGSRPLVVCATKSGFYYGEYRRNIEKSEIKVWYLSNSKRVWEAVYSFHSVRHIHGIFEDPHTNKLWITTGDDDNEAAIWTTDYKFSYMHKVLSGSQKSRAVQLLFDNEFIYYGSDAPDEINYLYRMKKNGTDLRQIQQVAGSVFFGCCSSGKMYFSTAVEPSRINKLRYAQVWSSTDGENWSLIYEARKDRLSMKYFQYGQILFPSFQNHDTHLYFTPFACENHDNTLILDA